MTPGLADHRVASAAQAEYLVPAQRAAGRIASLAYREALARAGIRPDELRRLDHEVNGACRTARAAVKRELRVYALHRLAVQLSTLRDAAAAPLLACITRVIAGLALDLGPPLAPPDLLAFAHPVRAPTVRPTLVPGLVAA